MTRRSVRNEPDTVDAARALATSLTASVLVVAIAAIPVERPSAWTVPALEFWVAERGAVALAIVVAQAMTIAAAAALAISGATATLAHRSDWAGRVSGSLAPSSMRRWWAGGALAAVVATAAPAGAAEAIDEAATAAPELIDLGPAATHDDVALLYDLGPVDDRAALTLSGPDLALAATASTIAPPVADHLGGETWPVTAGDHLWHIAESTLHDRGEPTDETSVLAYWQQLIDANRLVLGDDVDLIHPGEVIHLPASVTAGS